MMHITKLNKERKDLIERLRNGRRLANKKLGLLEPYENSVKNNLYHPLSKIEEAQLQEADGNELEWKASRVNSSACLLLNVFSGIRQGKELEIIGFGRYLNYELEKKLQVLNGRGKKANIDMVLENEDSYVYIESKFTELFYYQKKKNLSDRYSLASSYPSKNIYLAAKQLFHLCNHFDGNQLVKHAIGIYRDGCEHKDRYQGKKVVLLNLNWELHNYHYRFEDSYHLQLLAINEASMFTSLFNRLMKKAFKEIGIDFQLIYMNYHDFVYHLSNIHQQDQGLLDYLFRRYFFYHQRKVCVDERIDYYQSHINDDLAIDDIDDYLNQYHVIHINDQFDIHQIDVQKEWLDISDAIVFIGPNITDVFPGFIKKLPDINYIHVCSPIYFNKYSMIYFKQDGLKLKQVVIE